MRIDYLQYFAHLAEVLNYTKAAQDLYIAQPTLSIAMKRMEEELGFKLFERGDRNTRIKLTEMGKIYYEYVMLALNNLETGARVAREVKGEINSVIRVGTIYAMQGRTWSQAMQAFTQECDAPPKISIEQAYSPELAARLRAGSLDVAFGARVEGTEDLDRILVWSQPLMLAVHKDNPLAKKRSLSLNDLKEREILTYALESPVSPNIDAFLPIDEMNLRRQYDDEITLCAMVSSDSQKIALLCYSFLCVAFEDVVYIPIEDLPIDFHKVYLMSRRETHPKIVDDFIGFMSAYRFPNVMKRQD